MIFLYYDSSFIQSLKLCFYLKRKEKKKYQTSCPVWCENCEILHSLRVLDMSWDGHSMSFAFSNSLFRSHNTVSTPFIHFPSKWNNAKSSKCSFSDL